MDSEHLGIQSATKDVRHLTPEWEPLGEQIAGVCSREVRNIVTRNGVTIEIFRKDWGVVASEVTSMIHVTLQPGAVSAWHMHERKTDHLFVVGGQLRAALFDDREGSATRGRVDVHHLSPLRPMLVRIPPGIWHGLQVLSHEPASFVNFFDLAYDYDDPDDWRLPPDTTEIPFQF